MHIFDMSHRFRAKPMKKFVACFAYTPNLQNLSQGCISSFCFWLRTDRECSLAELQPLHPTIHPNYEVIHLNNALPVLAAQLEVLISRIALVLSSWVV